ncbi:serpin family protein [Paenibacillus tarimensis]
MTIYQRLLTALAIAAMLLSAIGCGGKPPGPASSSYSSDDVDAKLVNSYNRFTFKLYKEALTQTTDQAENIFLSPLSMAFALSLTLNGAKADTSDAMMNVLQLGGTTVDEINAGNEVLIDLLRRSDQDVKLAIANSIWAREGKPFYEDFLKRNETYYDARISTLDFGDPSAAATINKWVSEETGGNIDTIIESPIDGDTIMFLLNAVYFKGQWTVPFNPKLTKDTTFTAGDGSAVPVAMMQRTGDMEHLSSERYEAVRLPYGQKAWNMTVILPGEGVPLRDIYDELLDEDAKWREPFEIKSGTLQLPRFQLEHELHANDVLKQMGMAIAFDQTHADFSGMAAVPPNIYIGNVKHKTFVEVNEEGTEASAVTSVEMKEESATVAVDTFHMVVDRPFFFVIEDRTTGVIMFIGTVANPE